LTSKDTNLTTLLGAKNKGKAGNSSTQNDSKVPAIVGDMDSWDPEGYMNMLHFDDSNHENIVIPTGFQYAS